tara:strand:+ start:1084 stop:1299 length:216 start_codon:yes stop_codon:yes gene_type:complete
MATKSYSDSELQIMQLRGKVLETALHSASVNTIKNPMAYCEELWSWVADVGQPEEVPVPKTRTRGRPKKSG